jgi:hypothetical protein|tara:strand:- start:20 stop:511 length:492 start_codon:yes stop_codon:yes gene_type:complete
MKKTWSGKLTCLFHGVRHWELTSDLWFATESSTAYFEQWKKLGVNIAHIKNSPNKSRITVPKGYHTDLASIHRVAWSFIAPWDIARASIIHDVLMEAIRSDIDNLSKKQVNELRKNADKVLRDGMKQAEPKVPKWKQKACYRVVRMLGGLTLRHSSYRERHNW